MKYSIFLIILFLLLIGCTTQSQTLTAPTSTEPANTITDTKVTTLVTPNDVVSQYNGNVLAGNQTPYIEFNTEDYQKALSDNKLIFLYFYSNDDSKSRLEEAKILSVFNSMVSSRVIGFKVHYDDAMTTDIEKQLASELQIADSATKIILKNGTVVQRSTASWDTRTYSQQIFSYLN
jgi:hypothetical protein